MAWERKTCVCCSGYGVVSDYGNGEDFYGPKECISCNGSGQVYISAKGTVAQWPGGPFLGRLSKAELLSQSTRGEK